MSFVASLQEGPILTLTLDRPEALNALNAQVLEDIDAALAAVDLETVRCLIITGTGEKAFAAGADIAAMANMTAEEAADFSRRGNEVFRRIETFPLPTIAAVNGYALGGGCELSMACDIRLCSENAVFGQPEVTLGITPGFGGTQRLMRFIGMGRAKELIFSARTVKAPEALEIIILGQFIYLSVTPDIIFWCVRFFRRYFSPSIITTKFLRFCCSYIKRCPLN